MDNSSESQKFAIKLALVLNKWLEDLENYQTYCLKSNFLMMIDINRIEKTTYWAMSKVIATFSKSSDKSMRAVNRLLKLCLTPISPMQIFHICKGI